MHDVDDDGDDDVEDDDGDADDDDGDDDAVFCVLLGIMRGSEQSL